jgi:AraC family transcriptional regulator
MGSSGATTLALDDFRVTEARFPAGERLAPHTHDRAAFAVMLEGSFDLGILGRTYACVPGTAFVEPIEERHSNLIGTGGAHVVVIQPDPAAVSGLGSCSRLFDEPHHEPHSPVNQTAWAIVRELQAPDSATPIAVEGLVLGMLALASRQQRLERLWRTPRWLARAREQLHARFLTPPRIPELAAEAGVHPDHLARAFRQRFGVPLGAYVRRLRLDWAATRLLAAPDTIAHIALASGFADQSHFTRAFKRHSGLTPAAYRRTFGS